MQINDRTDDKITEKLENDKDVELEPKNNFDTKSMITNIKLTPKDQPKSSWWLDTAEGDRRYKNVQLL